MMTPGQRWSGVFFEPDGVIVPYLAEEILRP